MNGGDFDSLVGSYRCTAKEYGHAAAIVLTQISLIAWFYFNDRPNSISMWEGIIAGAAVVGGCAFILTSVLRTVIVDQDSLRSRGVFGLFVQKVDLSRVKGIRFGWFSQGVAVEFLVDGKRVRIAGNERFLKALRTMARRLDEAEPTASGR